jgi:uncharacterized membrane protein YhhN
MFIMVLFFCAAVSAVFCIRSKYIASPFQLYIFKPLTTILILCIAFFAGRPSGSTYWVLIMTGIVFSLAGDIFLMLPSDRFIAGLISFFIAHLLFIIAFSMTRSPGLTWWLAGILFILGIWISFLLLPYAGNIKIPVLLYMAVIVIMNWQAWERWMDMNTPSSLLAGIGASTFLLSDSFLAFNRFRKKINHADAIVLGTYYPAIALIALSAMQ